jgi:hypothetical protein
MTQPSSSPRRTSGRAVRLVALAGAAFLVAGTFLPANGGGRAGWPYAVFDRSVQRELELFAGEPLAAAALAAAAALFLLDRRPWFTSGALVAFGVQTLVFFAAHVSAATFGNPLYNSFGVGGVLGLAGALLLLVAGALAYAHARRAAR